MKRGLAISTWAVILAGVLLVLGWRRMMAAGDAALDALLPPRRH